MCLYPYNHDLHSNKSHSDRIHLNYIQTKLNCQRLHVNLESYFLLPLEFCLIRNVTCRFPNMSRLTQIVICWYLAQDRDVAVPAVVLWDRLIVNGNQAILYSGTLLWAKALHETVPCALYPPLIFSSPASVLVPSAINMSCGTSAHCGNYVMTLIIHFHCCSPRSGLWPS